MADHSTTGAPALSTDIESGRFDEKEAHPAPAKAPIEDEEEDEDMDALIDDLESNDGHGDVSFTITSAPPPTTTALHASWLRAPNHGRQLRGVGATAAQAVLAQPATWRANAPQRPNARPSTMHLHQAGRAWLQPSRRARC